MKTIAILGYPGAGKTWAAYQYIQALLKKYGFEIEETAGRIGLVDFHIFNNEIVVVGKYDGSKFQGTDRLSMAVAPHFVAFFAEMSKIGVTHIIAEGDRINCMPFFKTAMYHGQLERIKCNPDEATLRKQREQRNHVFPQSFLATVATKVDKHTFDQELDSNGVLNYLNSL